MSMDCTVSRITVSAKRGTFQRTGMNRRLSIARYRNRAKIREPAISVKMNGKKYTPVGNRIQPSVSLMAAAMIATTGPKIIAPSALTKKPRLIISVGGAIGMATDFSATRTAMRMAATASMRTLPSSRTASRQ